MISKHQLKNKVCQQFMSLEYQMPRPKAPSCSSFSGHQWPWMPSERERKSGVGGLLLFGVCVADIYMILCQTCVFKRCSNELLFFALHVWLKSQKTGSTKTDHFRWCTILIIHLVFQVRFFS